MLWFAPGFLLVANWESYAVTNCEIRVMKFFALQIDQYQSRALQDEYALKCWNGRLISVPVLVGLLRPYFPSAVPRGKGASQNAARPVSFRLLLGFVGQNHETTLVTGHDQVGPPSSSE